MNSPDTGYYWAYRKGSPVPDIVYVWKGHTVEIVHDISETVYGHQMECLTLELENLSEQKWILGEKIVPPGVDNLP